MFPLLVFFVSSFYSIRKWSNAISAYIILCIWVYGDVRLGPLSVITCYILFVLLYYLLNKPKRRKGFVFSKLIFYFSLYILLLYVLFSFLGTDMSAFTGLSSIKSYLFIYALLNLFWSLDISQKDVNTISNVTSLSVILLGIYCVFSYITSTNYYMEYMSTFMTDGEGTRELLDKSMNNERGILHGRISGTSYNCLPFSILLSILFYYILSFKDYVSKHILITTLVFIIICIYLTGSRGSMAAVAISFSFYLMRTMSIKKLLFLLIVLFVILESPFVSDILSIVVTNEVGGSTSEQRTEQFIGALELVSSNFQSLLFGRGIGFTSDYLHNYGPHPLCLGFESTLVYGLVEYGIIGLVFIFLGRLTFCLYIAYMSYKKNYIKRDDYYLLMACLLCNLIYNVLIGGGYDSVFIIAFFMMLKFLAISNINVCNAIS